MQLLTNVLQPNLECTGSKTLSNDNDNLRTFYPLNKVNIDNRSNVKREKDVNVNSERFSPTVI